MGSVESVQKQLVSLETVEMSVEGDGFVENVRCRNEDDH